VDLAKVNIKVKRLNNSISRAEWNKHDEWCYNISSYLKYNRMFVRGIWQSYAMQSSRGLSYVKVTGGAYIPLTVHKAMLGEDS
jgi:hypothetical protein